MDVRRRIESERVRESVKLQGEDVEVQRRPGRRPDQPRRPDHGAGMKVPVYEEEAVIEKRPVVKEQVIISTHPRGRNGSVEDDVDVEKHEDMRSRNRDRTRG